MIVRAVLSMVMGHVSDRRGSKLTVVIGGVSLGLGIFLAGRASAIWHLYIFYSIMGGLGAACFYVPLSSTLSKWFTRKRGLVLGIFTAGMGLGTVIFSPLTEYLISRYDWRYSYTIIGVIILVAIPTSAFFLRESPEAMGLKPDGEGRGTPHIAGADRKDSREKGLSLKKAMLTVPFWLLLFVETINYMTTITPLVHIVPHATDVGISPMFAASILASTGGFSIVGRLMLGGLSDRVQAKKILPWTFVAEAVMLFFLIVSKDVMTFYIFSIVFGFAYGGSIPLIPAMTAEFFGVGSMGAIFGVISFVGTLGGALGPYAAGYIHDVTHGYTLAFLILGVLASAAAVLSFYLSRVARVSPRREAPGEQQNQPRA